MEQRRARGSRRPCSRPPIRQNDNPTYFFAYSKRFGFGIGGWLQCLSSRSRGEALWRGWGLGPIWSFTTPRTFSGVKFRSLGSSGLHPWLRFFEFYLIGDNISGNRVPCSVRSVPFWRQAWQLRSTALACLIGQPAASKRSRLSLLLVRSPIVSYLGCKRFQVFGETSILNSWQKKRVDCVDPFIY